MKRNPSLPGCAIKFLGKNKDLTPYSALSLLHVLGLFPCGGAIAAPRAGTQEFQRTLANTDLKSQLTSPLSPP